MKLLTPTEGPPVAAHSHELNTKKDLKLNDFRGN